MQKPAQVYCKRIFSEKVQPAAVQLLKYMQALNGSYSQQGNVFIAGGGAKITAGGSREGVFFF
jgi:hypothetical protein